MTATAVSAIETVLTELRRKHYECGDVGLRHFMRDKRQLKKAITRYGYECTRRGWHFDAQKIQDELLNLLTQIRATGADIHFLPHYLEGAVDRHIRLEADRLSSEAKSISPRVTKAIAGIKTVTAILQPSDAEIMATVHLEERKHQAERRRKPALDQGKLL